MANDLLLHNVRPMAGQTSNVLIRNGYIDRIGDINLSAAVETIDGNNAILIPGLVEAHTHLDKTLLGTSWYRNEVGPSLTDRIENERQVKKQLQPDVQHQAERLALLAASKGSTHIRTHVDVDTEIALSGIESVCATRDKLKDIVDIEIVAFPQSGMLIRPGTSALLEDALSNGADVIGGIDPAGIDRDPKGHLDTIFNLAEHYACPIDIHLHETAELGAFSMELIIERTEALSMQGKVTISHAFCLGMDNQAYVASLIDQLARAQVHIMTVGIAARPTPPVKALREAGVVVCAGSDGIRDTWTPYGNADMLERAMHIGMRNNFRRDDEIELALEICTYGGGQIMALENYGITPGCNADLVMLAGETLAEAVVNHAPRLMVIKHGRITAHNGDTMHTQ